MNPSETLHTSSAAESGEPAKAGEVLLCSNLSRRYQQGNATIDVLSDLDLVVKAGERCAIVGASGSGKSTLLALLGGLDQPSSGSVELAGQNLSGLSDRALSELRCKQLGFVYQFHHLLPEFTALENIVLPQILAGCDSDRATSTARQWLEKVGLEDRAEHQPAELSGGERQRVAIARALVNSPSCVLMDEPTGNLDSASSGVVLSLIDELSVGSSTAFVVVTHDADVAAVMDRQYELSDGKLLLADRASDSQLNGGFSSQNPGTRS